MYMYVHQLYINDRERVEGVDAGEGGGGVSSEGGPWEIKSCK